MVEADRLDLLVDRSAWIVCGSQEAERELLQ
jgi:hypothetical protein